MSKKLFFNDFFDLLNNSKINYCIMNSYSDFPNNINGDIDIVVDSISSFNIFLKNIDDKNNIIILQRLIHAYKCHNIFICKFFKNKQYVLSLDVYENYLVNSRVFFNSDFFLKDRLKYKNFYVPHSKCEYLYYFIKKIIKKDIDKNIDFFFDNFCNEISFNDYFSKTSNDIYDAFVNKNKIYFSQNKEKLRFDLFSTVKPNYVIRLYEFFRLINRIIFPTGLAICFLGPDGSGKSTVIQTLNERDLPFRKIKSFHLKLSFSNNKNNIDVKNPQNQSAYKGVLSYMKLAFFALEYIFGYFKVRYFKTMSSLVIFDRYYDDIFVDPKRYRYGGSTFFARIIRFIIPKNNVSFVLSANPQVILSRKKEVSRKELKRQLLLYRKLADSYNYNFIDVNRDIADIVDDIERIIYKTMHERY